VADAYGLAYTASSVATDTLRALGVELSSFNGDDTNRLPAAATFVIGQDGRIRFASVSGDYRWRVGPEEVLAVLRG
jgi:peroxiredoxin